LKNKNYVHHIFCMSSFIFICLFSTPFLQAEPLIGEGYGPDEATAKQNALLDLATQVSVQVKSSVEGTSEQDVYKGKTDYRESIRANVKTTTDIPILGANFKFSIGNKTASNQDNVLSRAILVPEQVIPKYSDRLALLRKDILASKDALSSVTANAEKESILHTLLNQVTSYNLHRIVAVALGAKDVPDSPVTEAAVKAQIATVEKIVDTTEKAAAQLASFMTGKDKSSAASIYVYPPTTAESKEITEFGRSIQNALLGKVNAVQDPKQADALMVGGYSILKDTSGSVSGIEVTYKLMEKSGPTVYLTTSVQLLPQAFTGIDYLPKTSSLQALIDNGVVQSNDFRIDVMTNRGSSDLIFQKGDTVDILVKLNRQGYFYGVEHVHQNEGAEVSSLLELYPNNAPDERKFVRFVNADEVNKWINIGSFEVTGPFGIERLQFLASTQDLAKNLPPFRYNADTQFYVISDKPEKAIPVMRGMLPKEKKEGKILNAETSLTYTTAD